MPPCALSAFATVLAQHGGGSGGETVMTIMLVTVLTVIWVALGVVCWIFWRAKKREDAAMRTSTASLPRESDPDG